MKVKAIYGHKDYNAFKEFNQGEPPYEIVVDVPDDLSDNQILEEACKSSALKLDYSLRECYKLTNSSWINIIDFAGWISIEDELPPLNLNVIVLFPNVAYSDCLTATLGKRIDDVTIENKHIKLSVLKQKDSFTPFVTHWAYNNGQQLPNICTCWGCQKKKKLMANWNDKYKRNKKSKEPIIVNKSEVITWLQMNHVTPVTLNNPLTVEYAITLIAQFAEHKLNQK